MESTQPTHLSPHAITRAETLARQVVASHQRWGCQQPVRVVWSSEGQTIPLCVAMLATSESDRARGREAPTAEEEAPIRELHAMRVYIDSITEDAITLVERAG